MSGPARAASSVQPHRGRSGRAASSGPTGIKLGKQGTEVCAKHRQRRARSFGALLAPRSVQNHGCHAHAGLAAAYKVAGAFTQQAHGRAERSAGRNHRRKAGPASSFGRHKSVRQPALRQQRQCLMQALGFLAWRACRTQGGKIACARLPERCLMRVAENLRSRCPVIHTRLPCHPRQKRCTILRRRGRGRSTFGNYLFDGSVPKCDDVICRYEPPASMLCRCRVPLILAGEISCRW